MEAVTNILIAGSRAKWWPEPDRIAEFVDGMLDGFDLSDDVLINGMADGVDEWARQAAERRGIQVDPHPAQWRPGGVFDPSAGARRNAEMVALADNVYVVWDGRSPGSRSTIELALRARKNLEVIFPLTGGQD